MSVISAQSLDLTFQTGDGPVHALRDVSLDVAEGEFVVVPRGVEHSPKAAELAEVLLFEPATTRNTGNVDHGYTIDARATEHPPLIAHATAHLDPQLPGEGARPPQSVLTADQRRQSSRRHRHTPLRPWSAGQ